MHITITVKKNNKERSICESNIANKEHRIYYSIDRSES